MSAAGRHALEAEQAALRELRRAHARAEDEEFDELAGWINALDEATETLDALKRAAKLERHQVRARHWTAIRDLGRLFGRSVSAVPPPAWAFLGILCLPALLLACGVGGPQVVGQGVAFFVVTGLLGGTMAIVGHHRE